MVVFAILLGSSGAIAAAKEEVLLIVDGAQNLFRIPRSDVSRQISYTVDLEYPGRAIGEPQWEQLRRDGWVRCRSVHPAQEAANADWVSFIDAAEPQQPTIHQHLTYWSKGDQLIMIGLRYSSASRNGHVRSQPDSTEQRVDLFFDDERGRENAEWLQLDCSR